MADLLIDKALIDKVKKENGTVLTFDNLSDSVKEKLRDEHIIGIIDKHFMLDCAIKEIDLTDCVGITDATLVHIANKCKRLKHLFVSRCVNITEDGIQAIAEKIGKNLDSLYYSGCNRCTDAALQAVVQHCPNLVELWADDTGITQMPESIGNLPKLRELCLENNGIKAIPPSFTLLRHTLRDFRISGNPLQHPPPPLEVAQRSIKEKQHYVSRAANATCTAIFIACLCCCCPYFYCVEWCEMCCYPS